MVTPPVPRTDTSFHTVKGVGKALRDHKTTVPDAELAPKPVWAMLPGEPFLLPLCQQRLQRPRERSCQASGVSAPLRSLKVGRPSSH